MATIKWSSFPTQNTSSLVDKIVGLDAGLNVQFQGSETPTAHAFSAWDANKNMSMSNALMGYATTVTAAGTTTLTVASAYKQFFTGATSQTVVMPVVSTLTLGQSWFIVNNSGDDITVNSSGGNTIIKIRVGESAIVTCILLTGTTDSSWSPQLVVAGGLASIGAATSLTNNVIKDVCSFSLFEGDWDCFGEMIFGTGTSNLTLTQAWMNTVSVTQPASGYTNFSWSPAVGSTSFAVPYKRVSVPAGSTTTLYLTANAAFASGSVLATGTLNARRAKFI